MASKKLSGLTAITSVGDDDLVYVADTADGGSTYSSKRVTKANLFSGFATTAAATALAGANETHIDNLATLSGVAKDSTGLGTFSGADIARVTTLDCGVVVVMQDKEAGTFTLNGGGESLVYSYDSSLSDVSLDAISASTNRIHVSFRYYDTDSSEYLFQIVTFDAVSDS